MFHTLQQIIDSKTSVTTDDLNEYADTNPAVELQTRLCNLGILDPIYNGDMTTPFGPVSKADGKIGANTRNALYEFCRLAHVPYVDRLLTTELLKALVSAQPDVFLPVQLTTKFTDGATTRLAKRILRYMQKKGYWIARSGGMYNIVYVEGMNADGSLNPDTFDEWNDRRMVIRVAPGGLPEIVVNEEATTEPGRYYTENPLNAQGGARIAFGQYKAWGDGLHKGEQPALVQQANVRVHRDKNKDGKRSPSDPVDIGDTFGINQHSTREDLVPTFVGRWSAGCLVGRRYPAHLNFLDTVRKDVRYEMNKRYLFVTAVIAGDDLLHSEPA